MAAFGAFGLAVGLALQGNLSNFASGLLILVFKPFKAGDWIAVGGVEGSVKGIQMLNTAITTKDNKTVFIPNSTITTSQVSNSSYQTERYITFLFDIGYNNDHHKAIALLKQIFKEEPRILNADDLEIGIKEFGDNSVRIAAYPKVAKPITCLYSTIPCPRSRTPLMPTALIFRIRSESFIFKKTMSEC